MNENQHRRLKHGDRPAPGSLNWDDSDRAAEAAQPASTDAELAKLKALALAATPGPWEATRQTDDECSFMGYFIEAEGKTISDDGTAPGANDAQFIAAANPAVVLDLIARIERAAVPSTASADLPADLTYLVEYVPHAAARRALASKISESIRAAVSAATKPTADLSKLPRYDATPGAMVRDESGYWVPFRAVQSLLATKPAGVPEPAIATLRSFWTGGYWKSVSHADCDAIDAAFSALAGAAPTAAPADQAEVRNAALEEAAKLSEGRVRGGSGKPEHIFAANIEAKHIAAAIRALRTPAAGTEGAE